MFSSAALHNVQQLGLEFHHVAQNLPDLFRLVQNLHRIGYRIINWEANFNFDFVDGVADVFEILFRRGNYCAGLKY